MKTDQKASVERLLALQQLLLQFSQVNRTIHRRHGEVFVQENDTEHSYNLAMTAWYVCQYFPDLDRDLLIRYALVHDLIEVHAGDTYIYGNQAALASKEQREAEAFTVLKEEWKDFTDMTATIAAYEQKSDNESRFVYALDKIMPIMLVYIHDGYSWSEAEVTLEMLYRAKKDKVAVSPEILPYFEQLYELLLTRPDLIKPA